MKLTVTLKDPDGFAESVREAVEEEADNVLLGSTLQDINRDARRDLIDSRERTIKQALQRWVEFDEYITIEFDADAGTATVEEVK